MNTRIPSNAQAGLAGSLPVGFLLMIITSICLFGRTPPAADHLADRAAGHYRALPRACSAANGAFDFMSLLGALSLIGLLIKNAIVLDR